MQMFNYTQLDELALESFNCFKNTLESLAKTKDLITVALSGGSSVKAIYDQIKERGGEIGADVWSKVRFCFADERIVPLTSEDSNYKFVMDLFLRTLVDRGLIKEEAVLKVKVDEEFPHISYTEALAEGIDIALLGVGPDSHTCSLFPDHSSVTDCSEGFIFVDDSPKPPSVRISMSRALLTTVEYPFLFFIGESKRDAFEKFSDEQLSESQVPVKIVRRCSNPFIFTQI